jgi:hypothetical protein
VPPPLIVIPRLRRSRSVSPNWPRTISMPVFDFTAKMSFASRHFVKPQVLLSFDQQVFDL